MTEHEEPATHQEKTLDDAIEQIDDHFDNEYIRIDKEVVRVTAWPTGVMTDGVVRRRGQELHHLRQKKLALKNTQKAIWKILGKTATDSAVPQGPNPDPTKS